MTKPRHKNYVAVTVDLQLKADMTEDMEAETTKDPSRSKMSYREMILIYRAAWLKLKGK